MSKHEIEFLTKWAVEPIKRLIDETGELISYANLVSGSISIIATDNVSSLLQSVIFTDPKSKEQFLQIVENAKREKDWNYKHLEYQFLVTIFSYLDGGIKEFIISLLKHRPSLYDIPEIKKITIGITEYKSMTEDEIARYTYSEYAKIVTKNELYGIKRFNNLLRPLGFHIDVDNETSSAIFELARIRNVIVHSLGRIDENFVKYCPNLSYKIGDQLTLNSEDVNNYGLAVISTMSALSRKIVSEVERMIAIEKVK